MPIGTPRLERIKAAVSARFPDALFGQFNCRRRNGWNWSQHAGSEPVRGYRGNAIDIVHKDHGYGDTSPAHQAWLDKVHAYLFANRVALDLNELIWRKRNHFDHIHTSPYPKLYDAGTYKPPCKGGTLIVVNKDKSRGTTFNVDAPPPPPPTLEDDMALRRGDRGKAVEEMQRALIAWDPDALPKFKDDGDYGGETLQWVGLYQAATELDRTEDNVLGVCDGVTLGYLLRELPVDSAHRDHPPQAHDHPISASRTANN